ncbi:MAG: DUF6492 family protein [Gammaproteobacteria bacterium]
MAGTAVNHITDTFNQRIGLFTVTWGRDKPHFELLRASIERSALRELPHYVVVQSEDLDAFRQFEDDKVVLMSTADVLPEMIEKRRRYARMLQEQLGRTITRLAGSCCQRIGVPIWPRYTGWHTQQLVKLFFCLNADFEHVAILDSDILVTPHASTDDFLGERSIVCYRKTVRLDDLDGKVVKWNKQAWRLFDREMESDTEAEAYFDTPFVMNAPAVRDLCAWLENRYGKSWWQVLIEQPVRRWSEFGLYRVYLRQHVPASSVEWRNADNMQYIFDVGDSGQLIEKLESGFANPDIHYITLHSQNSGRQLWDVNDYAHEVRDFLGHQS